MIQVVNNDIEMAKAVVNSFEMLSVGDEDTLTLKFKGFDLPKVKETILNALDNADEQELCVNECGAFHCPKCSELLINECMQFDYCPNCGKKIKW